MNAKLLIILGMSVLVAFTVNQSAHGMWFPLSPEELLEQSDTVFVGTVTAIAPVDVEYESQIARDGTVKEDVGPETMTLEEYTIDVEEFLKDPQETDTMKVLRATVSGVPGGPVKISGFEIGDRVLFYLPKDEGQTHFAGQYLPESFKIPIQCDAKNVLMQPRIDGGNTFDRLQDGVIKHDNFTAGMPIEFVYKRDMGSLEGKSFDFQITIRKETEPDKYDETVLSEKIPAKSNSCEWIASAKAELVPQAGNYKTWVHIAEGTGGSSFSGSFSVKDHVKEKTMILPLKQFKSGIPFSEIKCNANLQLTQRYDGTPACVKDGTVFELIRRGWTSDIIRLVQSRDVFLDPKDATSSYMDRITPTLDDFKNILSESQDIDVIFSKFGQPHNDIGSGIHIYVYELNDSSKIWIGYVDDIWYVKHVDVNGSVLEDLFVKNED